MEIYTTRKNGTSDTLELCGSAEKGAWINLSSPNDDELAEISEVTGFPAEYLKAALDEEESPRIESDNGNTLILIDLPEIIADGDDKIYSTIPLGILINEDYIVTVCLRNNVVIDDFRNGRIAGCNTLKRTRFLLQVLYKNSQYFLRYLRSIDRKTNAVEDSLHKSMKNKELIELLGIEKSLVYFSTSLKANEVVLEKIMKFKQIKMYEDDADLLEDVIIENKQAIEMANIYSNILSGMMDAFAFVHFIVILLCILCKVLPHINALHCSLLCTVYVMHRIARNHCSTQREPSLRCSFFQMGARVFISSSMYSQPPNASLRCPAPITMMRILSPTSRTPIL